MKKIVQRSKSQATTTYYDICCDGDKVRLTIGNYRYYFCFTLKQTEIKSYKGKEKVYAWLTGVIMIPGIDLSFSEAEALLDEIDTLFPTTKTGLKKPKFRLF